MAATVRVGFLGAGLIATYHSKSLRRSGAPVTRGGVYDPDSDRANAFALASGHSVCASEAEVLDDCDAVYVCTWTSEHVRLVTEAVKCGKHVFCEKPLATDLAGAELLHGAVQRAGVVHQVGLVLRHSPAFNLARALINDPSAGAVLSVVMRDDQFIPIQGHYGSSWRGDRRKAGAGTLLEHSIHDVDVLRWLVDDVDSVSAFMATRHGLEGIEDVVVSTLRFRNQALGTLSSTWHDNLARPSLRRLEVFCERRHIVVDHDDWFGPVTWTNSDGSGGEAQGDQLLPRLRDLVGDQAHDVASSVGGAANNPDASFIDAILRGRPAAPDFDVALRAHQVVDAMYRSAAAEGSPIAVPRAPRRVDVADV
jgi:UDP-N-acetyl-2-amino-2-deoxyglucuronate dehydrogenase